MPKPLTDKDGEVVRPLTAAEAKELRPIAEVDPGMLEAVEAWRKSLERKGASAKMIDGRIRRKAAEAATRRQPKLRLDERRPAAKKPV